MRMIIFALLLAISYAQTVTWNEVRENKNCYEGQGATQNLDFLGYGYNIDSCKTACEEDDTCDCITFSSTRCWLRRGCDLGQCKYQAGVQSASGNRNNAAPAGVVYKVSNRDETTWRPNVPYVRVYSDSACTEEVEATFEEHSGSLNGNTDGSKAFDGDAATSWRPQCPSCGAIGCVCTVGEAWVTFSTSDDVKCVQAAGLGQGAGGGRTWNGGIKVEMQNEDGTWSMVMESTYGNEALIQDPVDCVLSEWSPGACSQTCGSGLSQSSRTIITYPAYGGTPCEHLEETVACNTEPCPADFTWEKIVCTNGLGTNCNLGNDKNVRATWPECSSCISLLRCPGCVDNCNNDNPWGRCWRTSLHQAKEICENHDDCTGITRDNGGYEPRSGSVDDATAHVAAHEMYVKVPNPIDCEVGEWVPSGDCSVTCGGGFVENTRPIITAPARGGMECPSLVQVVSCNPQVCPPTFEWETITCTNGPGTNCNLSNDRDERATWSECAECTALPGCRGCVNNCQNGNVWQRCWRTTLNEAKEICENHDGCTGITRDNGGYEPRSGSVETARVHPAAHELYVKHRN